MATAENPELSLSLVLDDEQKMLAENAAGFFSEHSPVDRVRKLRDEKDPTGFSKSLWKEMAELGFVGMNLPESYGGTGLGFFELAIVLEQVGRRLAPEPFLSTVLLGAQAILRGGSEAQKAEILPAIASGDRIVTVAYLEERSRFDLGAITTTARRTANGFVIDGKKIQVLDGHVADTFLVSARSGAGLSLLLVEAAAKGVEVVRQTRLDGRNVAIVTFQGVEVPETSIVGVEGAGLALLSRVVDVASIGLSAEMLGAAEQAFEETVEYLKVRKQFGVPIGSFQALQHRAARLFVEIALLRSAVLAAARTVDVNPADVPRLASLAKARANDTLIHVTNEAVQMHGGVGVTDECNVGFYVKRARACEATFGDSAYHRARWATFNGY